MPRFPYLFGKYLRFNGITHLPSHYLYYYYSNTNEYHILYDLYYTYKHFLGKGQCRGFKKNQIIHPIPVKAYGRPPSASSQTGILLIITPLFAVNQMIF